MLNPSGILTVGLIVNRLNLFNLRFRHFIGRHNDKVNVTRSVEVTNRE